MNELVFDSWIASSPYGAKSMESLCYFPEEKQKELFSKYLDSFSSDAEELIITENKLEFICTRKTKDKDRSFNQNLGVYWNLEDNDEVIDELVAHPEYFKRFAEKIRNLPSFQFWMFMTQGNFDKLWLEAVTSIYEEQSSNEKLSEEMDSERLRVLLATLLESIYSNKYNFVITATSEEFIQAFSYLLPSMKKKCSYAFRLHSDQNVAIGPKVILRESTADKIYAKTKPDYSLIDVDEHPDWLEERSLFMADQLLAMTSAKRNKLEKESKGNLTEIAKFLTKNMEGENEEQNPPANSQKHEKKWGKFLLPPRLAASISLMLAVLLAGLSTININSTIKKLEIVFQIDVSSIPLLIAVFLMGADIVFLLMYVEDDE